MKIINRVLDNYFSKKFAESLKKDIKNRYKDVDLDYKFNHEEMEIYLRLPRKKRYEFVCSFKKETAFECMCADRKKFNKFIDNYIGKYEFLNAAQNRKAEIDNSSLEISLSVAIDKALKTHDDISKSIKEVKKVVKTEDLNHGFMDKKSR